MNDRRGTKFNDDDDTFWKIHLKHVDWIFIIAVYIIVSLFVFPSPMG